MLKDADEFCLGVFGGWKLMAGTGFLLPTELSWLEIGRMCWLEVE